MLSVTVQKKMLRESGVSFIGDDEALFLALKAGQAGSKEALYDRYAAYVRRIIVRTLGTNVDLQDHLHNVFIEAFSSIKSLKDPNKLKSWLATVAVYTSIAHIRKKSRTKWLFFYDPQELPEIPVSGVDNEKREAVKLVYMLLDEMPVKERIPFTLRVIDQMPLGDVAKACNVSLATIKRRIVNAKKRFLMLAKKYPVLVDLMDENDLWRKQ